VVVGLIRCITKAGGGIRFKRKKKEENSKRSNLNP
tara:strand:- start:2194 stop:2298 length:105 start_codon:yes stop_codon:yes gene_type:complete